MSHVLTAFVAYPMTAFRRYYCRAMVGFWISLGLGATHPLSAHDRYEPVLIAHAPSASWWVALPSGRTSSESLASRHGHSRAESASGQQHVGKSDHYFVLPPCPINQYSSGEIIAVPKDQSPVLSATLKKGALPAGTALFPNGCLVVVDPAQLNVGTHRFAVETANEEGKTTTHSLTIKLKPSGQEDTDAMYAIRQPKALDQYVRGDVLAASQDHDGVIVRSEFVKGTLPAGASLTTDGQVVVDDPSQLQGGQYAAWIATEDERGGTTLFIITLML